MELVGQPVVVQLPAVGRQVEQVVFSALSKPGNISKYEIYVICCGYLLKGDDLLRHTVCDDKV